MLANNNMIQQIPEPPKQVSISSLVGVCLLATAKIALGVMHLDECTVQPYIPIYLIVFGSFTIIMSIIAALPWTRAPRDDRTMCGHILIFTRSLMQIFLFAWFITGSYWIYSIYAPIYYPGIFPYCSKVLYLFAFWTTTALYIVIAVGVVFCCIPILFVCCCGLLCTGAMSDVEDV